MLKFNREASSAQFTITGYGSDWVEINAEKYASPCVLAPDRIELHPSLTFDQLTPAFFESLLDWQPEVVLLGIHPRQRFPNPKLYATLTQQQIGLDAMDLHAACRTFNILSVEHRRVLAIILWG